MCEGTPSLELTVEEGIELLFVPSSVDRLSIGTEQIRLQVHS
jgi:hypothetical protein